MSVQIIPKVQSVLRAAGFAVTLLGGLTLAESSHAQEWVHGAGWQIWDDATAPLRPLGIDASQLEEVLRRAGAPTRPEEIDWPESFYHEAVRRGREIRDRYTFLDLAADSGELNDPSVF